MHFQYNKYQTYVASFLNMNTYDQEWSAQLSPQNHNKFCDADSHLLSSGELELRSPESFNDVVLAVFSGAHRDDWLTYVHPSYGALRLAERSSHPSLEPTMQNKPITNMSMVSAEQPIL